MPPERQAASNMASSIPLLSPSCLSYQKGGTIGMPHHAWLKHSFFITEYYSTIGRYHILSSQGPFSETGSYTAQAELWNMIQARVTMPDICSLNKEDVNSVRRGPSSKRDYMAL